MSTRRPSFAPGVQHSAESNTKYRQTFGTASRKGRRDSPAPSGEAMQPAGSESRSAAAQRGLSARGDYERLLDRAYNELADPGFASRYMSQAAARTLGGFGGQARGGAQVAAMGDIGARASEMASQRTLDALGLAQERQAAATEIEALKLDAIDRLQQIIADNRDFRGNITEFGRTELNNELARLELSVGADGVADIRSRIMDQAGQQGPSWLSRLFGARG